MPFEETRSIVGVKKWQGKIQLRQNGEVKQRVLVAKIGCSRDRAGSLMRGGLK